MFLGQSALVETGSCHVACNSCEKVMSAYKMATALVLSFKGKYSVQVL